MTDILNSQQIDKNIPGGRISSSLGKDDKDPMIDWDVAAKTANRFSKSGDVLLDAQLNSLIEDFAEVTPIAEKLVENETGLVSLLGSARGMVATREVWINANIASFKRLYSLVMQNLNADIQESTALKVSRSVTGFQVGMVLGWMSKRVLGQYDLLLSENDHPEEQDMVYFLGSNILRLENQFAFPPRQFRLWLAIHELTHRAQFTGVAWMRDYFKTLISQGLGGIAPDIKAFQEIFQRLINDIRSKVNPLENSGIIGIFASKEQLEILAKIQGLMSLLEGHGDVIMNSAAKELIPEAERFDRILHARRSNLKGATKLIQQLLGFDAKLRQYAQGEKFIESVISQTSLEQFNKVWLTPDNIPTFDEIKNPDLWLTRVK